MPVLQPTPQPLSPTVVSPHAAARLITSAAPVLVIDARAGDPQYRERVKGSIQPPSLTTLHNTYAHTILVYDSGTTALITPSTPANQEVARLHAYSLSHFAICLVKGGLPALRTAAPHIVLPPAALPPHVARLPWALSAFRALHAQHAPPAQVLPSLFVGSAVHATDPRWLSNAAVTHILAVGDEFHPPNFKNPVLSWSQIPVKDHPSQKLAPHFRSAFHFLDQALARQGTVLVHCLAGASRSIATVAAYLVSRGWPLDHALHHIKTLRPAADPNPGFISQLRHWEAICLKNPPSKSNPQNSFVPLSPVTPLSSKSLSSRRCTMVSERTRTSSFLIQEDDRTCGHSPLIECSPSDQISDNENSHDMFVYTDSVSDTEEFTTLLQ